MAESPPETSDPAAPPRERLSVRDVWAISIALGLAVLATVGALAVAFGWTSLERALDVRALFR